MPTSTGDSAKRLAAIEPRAWAQLLRALRRLEAVPAEIGVLLELPTSALAGGPRRADLCRSIMSAPDVLSALLADPALPSAAQGVLAPPVDLAAASEPPAGAGRRGLQTGRQPGPQGDGVVGDSDARASSRQRELRRELAEARRQREGADARAALAEARVADVERERGQLQERVAQLEDELARARDEVAQAVARVERRSATRADELERALAAERGALEALRRERDRDRATSDAMRVELDELRARPVPREPIATAASRPLVLPHELEPDTTDAARWLLDGAGVLLVDGYNVSLALRAGLPLVEQRRWLVERLRPLAIRGRTAPIVVFDGEGQGRTQRDPSGVEVRFTASGTIADDEIVFAVAATAEPVVVITDDSELQERVRAEGGNVLGTVHLLGAIEA